MKKIQSYIIVSIIAILSIFVSENVNAQYGPNDTIRTQAVIIGNDTLPFWMLPSVEYGEFIGSASRRTEIDRLRRNIYIVYPYAVQVKNILNKIDYDLGTNAKRKDRKKYLEKLDEELNKRYKEELKDLSQNQGRLLVKLIYRETGKDAYSLIKELKGGFNARMYQTAFKFIDNNLKAQYDPYGEDKDIEMIVKEIEHKYQARPR